ncbi:hypothetical protein I4602_10070 [Proteus mirabilis]|nr:hypothetical protein [Proteus mirabilis]
MHPNLVTCHERIAQCDLHHRTTGFDRHECLNLFDKSTSIKMAKAIISVENAQQPYVDDVFDRAFSLI